MPTLNVNKQNTLYRKKLFLSVEKLQQNKLSPFKKEVRKRLMSGFFKIDIIYSEEVFL